jgi:hypothetical protein
MQFKFLILLIIGVNITCFYAVEFWTGFMIKISRPVSILNELGSKFNTSGLNIQRWEMTTPPPPGHFSTRFKILRYTGEGLQNLGLCSALRAFEQGGIFIVPQLLWHGASVLPVSSEGPPHSVASYDTHGDVKDLFQPGSPRVPPVSYQSLSRFWHTDLD